MLSLTIVGVATMAAGLAFAEAAPDPAITNPIKTLPGGFPVVTMFPVSTQTSFPSPMCSKGPSPIQSFTTNYNFETVERGVPITAASDIGEYNLLNFTSILWADTDPDFDGNHLGLAPHTYPAVGAFGASGVPTISIKYQQSTLTSFDAHSFWYGCVFPSPVSAGSLPETCTITATGLDGKGKKIASQEYHFKANGSVVQDQNFGRFHGFNNLASLEFSVTPVTAAGLIDNFIATLHQKACAPFYLGSYNNGT